MNSLPIGVFDSGLGGLTVVRELMCILPNESICYFGDTGRVPYGNRSRETIRKYAIQDIRFLLQKRVKMIIAACGTVSSVAESVGGSLTIPFVGVVRPAVQAAVDASKSGRIGVIGTAATISSGSYNTLISELSQEAKVFTQACPLFVPLVEGGFISPGEEIARLTAERYLLPLMEKDIDTLILGCTHYLILRPIISKVCGDGVTLIDSGRQAALLARDVLAGRNALSPSTHKGSAAFYVSDQIEGFSQIASICLGADISGNVTRVDIDNL